MALGVSMCITLNSSNEVTLHLAIQIAMKAAYRLATRIRILLHYITITIIKYDMMLYSYIYIYTCTHVLSISFIVLYSALQLYYPPVTFDCRTTKICVDCSIR